MLDRLHRRLEFKLPVVRQYFLLQFINQHQHVAVDFQQIFYWQRILGRIEIHRIRQQKAQCVANAPVAFNHPLQNFIRYR